MKRIRIIQALAVLLALTLEATAQTSTTVGFAPTNFGNMILTSTPSNATGSSGVSTVFSSSGNEFTFGTGGSLVNPMQFNYVVTGPNTATLSVPASGATPATTTNLVFSGANSGTYTTVQGTSTTTGRFGLAAIPSSAPISNVSARTTISTNGSTTVGFVIAGAMPHRVLIRAVGPGLSSFGVSNAITNPSLSLYRGNQLLVSNDDWGTLQAISLGGTSGGTTTGGTTSGGTTSGTTTTGTGSTGMFTGTLANGSSFTTQLATAQDFTSVGAFALQQGSKDAAFIVTLPPGAYTVVVSNSASVTTSTGTTSGGTTGGTGTTTTGTTSGGTGTTTTGTTSGGTSSGTTTTGTTTGTDRGRGKPASQGRGQNQPL